MEVGSIAVLTEFARTVLSGYSDTLAENISRSNPLLERLRRRDAEARPEAYGVISS